MTQGTCCGCISINAGVIMLGVLSLLGGITDIIFGSVIFSNSSCPYSNCYNAGSWYATTTIIQGTIAITVSIILLIGVSQRKPNLLMPYVTMMIVNVIAYMCVAVLLLVNIGDYYGAYYGTWYLCWSCVVCYFIKVVRLYRVIIIQENLGANGLVTTYPVGAVLNQRVLVNPYPSVATVYTTQSAYATRQINTVYPSPGSYPQPGYPQYGNYQQQGIYPPQSNYPPPYPGNQPGK